MKRLRVFMAIALTTCSISQPAKAWIAEAIAVTGAVVGAVNSFTAGKASKAAAEAQQAQMLALLKNLEAIQKSTDLILKDLEEQRIQLQLLPENLEMREAALSASKSVELMMQYASVIIDRQQFNDQVLLQSNFDRMNNRLAEIDDQLVFFRREVPKGELHSIVNLAMLQEAYSIAHRALAVFSVDQDTRPVVEGCFAAIAEGGSQTDFERILRDAGLDPERVDCQAEQDAKGIAAYRVLKRFLEEQDVIWQKLLAPDGPLVSQLSKSRDQVLQDGTYTNAELYFTYPDYPQHNVARYVEDMNAILESKHPYYQGILDDEERSVCLILIPFWGYVTIWDTDNVSYFHPYDREVPIGALVWNVVSIPQIIVLGDKIAAQVTTTDLPESAKFIPFELEGSPLPRDWERKGFSQNPASQCADGAEIYASLFDLFPSAADRPQSLAAAMQRLSLSDLSADGVRALVVDVLHSDSIDFSRTRNYEGGRYSIFEFFEPTANEVFDPRESSYIQQRVERNLEITLSVTAYSAAVNARNNTREQIKFIKRLEDIL